jgi:outer membrane protease
MATDGVNFNKIGFENSKSEGGISSQKLNYEHHYFEPFTGTRFFRLKQTDFNGDFEYSNLIKVSTSPYKKQDINWHLALQILFITLEKPMDAEIEIFNCLGKLVFSKHIATSENVNLHNIATGVYYLKVNNNKPEKILITEKNE